MFRKDTDSTGEWSVANVELCASRQRRILHDIWNALKPGGLLVYSTCTYNTEEDEENIQYIIDELGAEPLSIPIDDAWGVCGALKYANPVYRFFPHRTRGEGFFLAALRKADGEREELRIKTQLCGKPMVNGKNFGSRLRIRTRNRKGRNSPIFRRPFFQPFVQARLINPSGTISVFPCCLPKYRPSIHYCKKNFISFLPALNWANGRERTGYQRKPWR